MYRNDSQCYSHIDLTGDLGIDDGADRHLYHGSKISVQKLLELRQHNQEMFYSGGNVCSTTPFLLAAALVLNRCLPIVEEAAIDYAMPLPAQFKNPILIEHNMPLTVANNRCEPHFVAQTSVIKNIALGKRFTGVAIVTEDYPGTYVIKRDPEIAKGNVQRVMNTSPYEPEDIEDYLEDGEMRRMLGEHEGFKYFLFDLLRDQWPRGVFVHETIRHELAQLGVAMPIELTTITMSSFKASRFFI